MHTLNCTRCSPLRNTPHHISTTCTCKYHCGELRSTLEQLHVQHTCKAFYPSSVVESQPKQLDTTQAAHTWLHWYTPWLCVLEFSTYTLLSYTKYKNTKRVYVRSSRKHILAYSVNLLVVQCTHTLHSYIKCKAKKCVCMKFPKTPWSHSRLFCGVSISVIKYGLSCVRSE